MFSSSGFSLLARLGHLAYWYCVDFMVNLAGLTDASYPEANTRVLLLLVRLWQRRRLRQLRNRVPSATVAA